MLAVLLLIAIASTSTTAERRPFLVDDELAPMDEHEISLLRRKRWGEDRELRAIAGIALPIDLIGSLDDSEITEQIFLAASLGLRQRFAADWDSQARASLVAAFFRLSAVDLDASFRSGSTRFYLGLGPHLRMVFAHDVPPAPPSGGTLGATQPIETTEHRPLALGGGGALEMGFLLGPNRTIDLGLRVTFGLTADVVGEGKHFYLLAGGGGTFSFPM